MTESSAEPLRPGRPDDAPALTRIAVAAFRPYVARIGRPPAPMLADYTAVLADHEVRVAEDGGLPVGFVVLDPHPDHLLVDIVAVHPAHHGRGIGRRLLDYAEDSAALRGLGELRLFTHETMTENLAIYLARGYVETGRGVRDGYRRIFLTKRVARRPGPPRRPHPSDDGR